MSLLLYIAELVLESLLLYIPFAVLHFISGNIIGSTSMLCYLITKRLKTEPVLSNHVPVNGNDPPYFFM